MVDSSSVGPSKPQGLSAHFKGHILLFEGRGAPSYGAAAGLRLLLIFMAFEGILGPRQALFELLRLPLPPIWVRVPLQRAWRCSPSGIAGLNGADCLHPWREWSRTEKSYFVQTALLANFISPSSWPPA